MYEYIERKAIRDTLYDADAITMSGVKILNQFPDADVAPVRHGRWIKDNNSLQTDDYYCCYFDYNCSECGNVVNNRYELPKYCPNCGAKMDDELNE